MKGLKKILAIALFGTITIWVTRVGSTEIKRNERGDLMATEKNPYGHDVTYIRGKAVRFLDFVLQYVGTQIEKINNIQVINYVFKASNGSEEQEFRFIQSPRDFDKEAIFQFGKSSFKAELKSIPTKKSKIGRISINKE